MSVIASEIIIVLLVLANGVFAMAEIAIISCRKSRLRKLAEQGDTRAQAALELAESPNRFLSTVQVGMTLIGVMAGAFGGATIAREIAKALEPFPVLARYAEAIGIGAVVLGITLLSVVLGELVPKRLALNNPLGVALALARPVRRLSDLTAPVVRLLSALTDAVLKLFGFQPKSEPPVTEDEVRSLVEEGHQAGVFFKAEKEMVEHAPALDRKCVGDLMTPHAAGRGILPVSYAALITVVVALALDVMANTAGCVSLRSALMAWNCWRHSSVRPMIWKP